MEPRKAFLASPFSFVLIFFFLTISLYGGKASSEEQHATLVEKGQRRPLVVSEYGEVSAIDVKGGDRAPFHHLQFITLDPNSVFLPVLLHADMVFYVHTGSGRLTYADEDGTRRIDLREGDLCKLSEGSAFYIQSNLDTQRKKLRIYAMFANTEDSTYDPLIGAYSRIDELIKGFDKRIIQAAFKVPEDLVEEITNKTNTPAIVHAASEEQRQLTLWEQKASFLRNSLAVQTNSNKVKTYNIFGRDPDFSNCNGWSLTVTRKQLKSLKHTNIGFLMVNLTRGSMLGPHWNPRATETAVVLQGQGMVKVVCGSSNSDNNTKTTECENTRFGVKEGDAFVVRRFHPMAQMSFNNDSFVFLGFSTATKRNYPQFLAGRTSVLRIVDREILATSLGVRNATVDQLLDSQNESVIFACVSCAEEEERIMVEEIEKKREEEEKRREEEEAREREEERERRREEEEKRKREEEEEAEREQEEARRQEEERRRREEEEQARREQEEARRQEEERERRRQEEEEAWRQREAAERAQEEAARREIERRREEEAEREQQEEREREREEEAMRREEEARRQQERWERRRQEAEARREEERRRQEEAEREQERAREEEETAEREQERPREEEGEGEGGGGGWQRRGEEEEEEEEPGWDWEQEAARRQQEERERRREGEGDNSNSMETQVEGRRVLKTRNV